jgi:hypothetical protein
MPAVSQKQQNFFGIVRAIQKGEMAPTTPETAKAAADMKKKDVKDFASTKHKGLPEKKVAKEATDFSQRDKIMKKAKPLHKHLFKNLHKGDRKGDVNERIDYADTKQMKKFADEKKKFTKTDQRMKFGKFYDKAKEAKDRLRPGEVKKLVDGKWVSNKD